MSEIGGCSGYLNGILIDRDKKYPETFLITDLHCRNLD
jgi:hypothetical protein